MSEVNKNIVQTFLQSKGLNNKAIAGVMGNIQQESNFDTTNTNKTSGAYGLFQWLGVRKNNLMQYAKDAGSSASDINTQLDFFWHELETTEKKSMAVLTESKFSTASEYAVAFEKSFERSGGSALGKRKSYAEAFYSHMNNSESIDISDYKPTGKSNNIGLVWWGDVVKVVLILLLIVLGVLMGVFSVNSTVQEMS